MKEKINTYGDDFSRLVDNELSKFISEHDLTHRKKHLGTAQKLSTIDYGSLPPKTKISDYTGSITRDYQLAVDHVDTRLSGGLQKVKSTSHIEDSKEATADVDRKIKKIDDELSPIVGKFDDSAKKHEPAVRLFDRRIIPITIIIGCAEIIANFQIFSLLGGGLISNIATAVLVGIFIHWYGFFTPSKVKKYGNGNPKKEFAIFLCFLIPLVVLFWQLSSMRIRYLTALNPDLEGVFVASPFLFTMINILAFIIIYWLVAYYRQPREVVNAYKRYRKDLKTIKRLNQEKEALQGERNKISPVLRDKLTDRYNILLLGKQKEQEIQSRMHACFEEFKLELLLKTNGAAGKLFTGDVEKDLPKLKLNYQDVQPKIKTA